MLALVLNLKILNGYYEQIECSPEELGLPGKSE
jgi:hypothetical protein